MGGKQQELAHGLCCAVALMPGPGVPPFPPGTLILGVGLGKGADLGALQIGKASSTAFVSTAWLFVHKIISQLGNEATLRKV